jgi:DNA processing protein
VSFPVTGTEELAAWLRLTLVPGVGGDSQRALLKAFGLPQHIFAASPAALAAVVPADKLRALLDHDAQAHIDAALEWARQPGNRIVTLADADYPRRLLDIPDPPTLLYVKGRIELLQREAVAVVGSRNATVQGKNNAEAFARALSEAGVTVVSGLALGIDAAAHRGGLQGAASTIAVIGTGADRIYPGRNGELARAIAERGALVSEFPLGTPPLAANFPRRNRLIAGLARGCLVVEAALASGSLITARLAAEQGRDVFAIPGSIHSPLAKGCHRLIKQGAKLVDDVQDVLDELGLDGAAAQRRSPAASCDDATRRVLEALGYDPCTVDQLSERSGLTPDRLYAMLLQLELEGMVTPVPGGRFQRAS